MKNLLLLCIILVLKVTNISAQTTAPEHPSIIPDINDSGEIQIVENANGSVFENGSSGTFDAKTKSIEPNSEPHSSSISSKTSYQTSKLLRKKSLRNLIYRKKQKKK